MALFVARHQHSPEQCPAGDPEMGPMLLTHLSPENAAKQGVTIQSEAVANGTHTLYLIVEADGQEPVDGFMAPFAEVGTVEVLAASPCAAVTARGSCALRA
jgi:hypothetical protein